MSLSLAEEAALLGEDPTPQEAWETTTHPPDDQEETTKSKVTARVVGPLDILGQIPLPPLGFGLPTWVSCPPPLENVEPLVHIPGEVQLDITSLSSMEMVTARNALTGQFEC